MRSHEGGGEGEGEDEGEDEDDGDDGGEEESMDEEALPSRRVTTASNAVQVLKEASAVVGMHPDQAAEHIVDFAVAHGKPFAVVPCCVYGAEFPGRVLPDGRAVKNYADLVELLVSKGSTDVSASAGDGSSGGFWVRQAVLPFEGKNIVVYGAPLRATEAGAEQPVDVQLGR